MQESISAAAVPPAGAAEPPDAMMHLTSGHDLTSYNELLTGGGSVSSWEASNAAGMVADGWFAAIADSAATNPTASLFVTLVSAAFGAIAVEYMATNAEPPVPDPLFSGLYKTFHGAVRAASKATGAVAGVAVGAAGPLVGDVAKQVQAKVKDLTGGP